MTDAWRYRCPQGHANLKRNIEARSYYCGSCNEVYRGEPYDAKHIEFPVRKEPIDRVDPDDVLETLVRMCEDPNTNWVASCDIEMDRSARRLGTALSKLEDDGLVNRLGVHRERWQPTDAGRERVFDIKRKSVIESQPSRVRGRGQVDPLRSAFLTVFVGVVLAIGYAIGSGVVV